MKKNALPPTIHNPRYPVGGPPTRKIFSVVSEDDWLDLEKSCEKHNISMSFAIRESTLAWLDRKFTLLIPAKNGGK